MNTIPIQAVRDALAFAIVKRVARTDAQGKPLGRVAAYTYYAPLTTVTCRTRRYRSDGPQRRFPGAHFGPMFRGDLDRLLERTRLEHGLPEVRRTWGAGMRALQAEFRDGVLR